MKIRDESILTIYEALLWLFKLCFLTTMFVNKIGTRSQAKLFLVTNHGSDWDFVIPRMITRVSAVALGCGRVGFASAELARLRPLARRPFRRKLVGMHCVCTRSRRATPEGPRPEGWVAAAACPQSTRPREGPPEPVVAEGGGFFGSRGSDERCLRNHVSPGAASPPLCRSSSPRRCQRRRHPVASPRIFRTHWHWQ